MIDVSVLLNRLDQLEAKVEQHDVIVAEHELKINSQQMEINQLKKKNSELEEKNHQLILARAIEKDDVANRDFLPRSCFEIKATNPIAQSRVYSIDTTTLRKKLTLQHVRTLAATQRQSNTMQP